MNRKLVIVGHWEHSKNEILHTVLGSCISVCFYCPLKKILVMSHMLLPSEKGNNFGRKGGDIMLDEAYNWLNRQGISLRTLEISIFGGGAENVGIYSYGLDGNSFVSILPGYQTYSEVFKTNGAVDAQKYQVYQALGNAVNQLSTIASNGTHTGTAQEAIASYQVAAQAYANLLNQYKASGGQLLGTEQYYLDNFNK